MEADGIYNGFTTDLQRIYNGTASEGAEGFRRISWKPVLISGMFFGGEWFSCFSMPSKRIQYDVNEIRIV